MWWGRHCPNNTSAVRLGPLSLTPPHTFSANTQQTHFVNPHTADHITHTAHGTPFPLFSVQDWRTQATTQLAVLHKTHTVAQLGTATSSRSSRSASAVAAVQHCFVAALPHHCCSFGVLTLARLPACWPASYVICCTWQLLAALLRCRHQTGNSTATATPLQTLPQHIPSHAKACKHAKKQASTTTVLLPDRCWLTLNSPACLVCADMDSNRPQLSGPEGARAAALPRPLGAGALSSWWGVATSRRPSLIFSVRAMVWFLRTCWFG
jgi:hypothetical protein